jgi:hypothetical protein
MRKIAIIAVLTIVAAFGGVVAAATTATAHGGPGETTGFLKRATTSYQEPSNRSMPVHYNLKAGQEVLVVCFTEGQEVNGNNVWYRIGQQGKLGFLNRDDVTGVNPNHLRHC